MNYKGKNEQISPIGKGLVVGCANGIIMKSVATDILDLPSLPIEARACHKFHEIEEPLISVRRLVDSGCTVHFIGDEVLIKDSSTGATRLRGNYSPLKNLYTMPL